MEAERLCALLAGGEDNPIIMALLLAFLAESWHVRLAAWNDREAQLIT